MSKYLNFQISKYLVPLVLLSLGLGLAAAEIDITEPIAELGNGASQEECREYCEDLEHIDACVSYATAHDLMTEEEAARARSFRADLEDGGGPGGCTSPAACEDYCSDIARLDECIAFAEAHGHSGAEVEDGRRIKEDLDSGGAMPGGCTGRDSCEAYCSNVDHMEECIAFAEEAGITMRDGHSGEDLSPDELRKVMKAMQEGRTPGGCTSKEECEAYCTGGEHFEECVAFGEEMGFVSHEDAEMARKTGGMGPGGCQSREACEAFCNEPANQQ